MKKNLFVIIALVFFAANSGCKKDTLQPSWWNKLWHKETVIMKDLNDKHVNVILPKIKSFRTTVGNYLIWDTDTIEINGPGGYSKLSKKAFRVWDETYHKLIMGTDTTKLSSTSYFAVNIIKPYLDLRTENSREDAFTKLWLCIPDEIYDQDGAFWEFFLSTTCNYLTAIVGGPDEWTDGTRSLWEEMKIYYLPHTSDPNDPWGYQCSGETRMLQGYLNYAEGDNKKSTPQQMQQEQELKEMRIAKVRVEQAQKRYNMFTSVTNPKFKIGNPEDYQTQELEINGVKYHVFALPVLPKSKK
jgi:hypothetical protein